MKIEIFEEEGNNILSFEDEFADFTIDVYPDSKTYQSRMRLKEDVYYRTEQFEYRIKTHPLKVESRLIERADEPPKRYCVKDGVVLESDILKDRGDFISSSTKEFIDSLKKEVEWHEDWGGNPVPMYILSKHLEIVTQEDYRRHLREMSEKINNATLKVKKALESDEMGLHVSDDWIDSGWIIWCSKSKEDAMSEEEIKIMVEHKNKLEEQFFNEQSKEYVGISIGEFQSATDILANIDLLLNKKPISINKEMEPKISKTKAIVISLMVTFLLSWIVSWFVDMHPLLIFVIVQVVAFAQSIIGGWLGNFFE